MTDFQIATMMREITAHEDAARVARIHARYTISEAERTFGVSRNTLYRWIQCGLLGWHIRRWGSRVIIVVTEGQVRDAQRMAKQRKSDNISAGVNRALGKESAS